MIAARLLEQDRGEAAVDSAERSLRVAAEVDDRSSKKITSWVVALLGEAGAWERAAEVARTGGDDYCSRAGYRPTRRPGRSPGPSTTADRG